MDAAEKNINKRGIKMAQTTILKTNLFKNEDANSQNRKPVFSNKKVIIETDIKAGTYSFAGWVWEDTGNLNLKIETPYQPDENQETSGASIDDDFA